MTDFYCDFDGGSDANDGSDWANANLTLEGLLSDMSAGDTGFVQGAATDTAASTRTFTSPGTITFPCKIIGVQDGTTNEPPLVADLAIRGTDTLPFIQASGASSDIVFGSGYATWVGLHFESGDQWNMTAQTFKYTFLRCELGFGDDMIMNGSAMHMEWVDCEYEPRASGVDIRVIGGASLKVYGGEMANTAAPSTLLRNDCSNVEFTAWDFTELGSNTIQSPSGGLEGCVMFKNCKTPATFTELGSIPDKVNYSLTMIGCDDGSTLAATSSYQNYFYGDAYGDIVNEATAVRTGGADDDATGLFSYAMTPNASATLESSGAALKSPWMRVWVEGGSNTLTVYIANDSASTDYLEDEVWVEFYTPDAGDTAQHDQTFDPADARLLDSSTAITDDATSSWGTGAANFQQLSVTVTTGFTGEVYARLHLAKRSATPDTLYLDPRIAVS